MTERFLSEATEAVARLAFRRILNGVRRIAEDAFIHDTVISAGVAQLTQLLIRLHRKAKLAFTQRAQYFACPFREPEVSITVID